MSTNLWKSKAPAEPGLYIASTSRNAGFVRYWTGKHWTAPLSVMDLHLTDRIPDAQGGKAVTHRNRPIQWLEAVTIDADGFISWGGKLDMCPVPQGMPVVFKKTGRRRGLTLARAGELAWATDVVAYMVPRAA